MSMDVNDLNKYISTHPITVQSEDVHTTVKLINDNDKVQIGYKTILEEVNTKRP